MSLPSGVSKIGNIRGPQGLPGTFGGATVAMIPAGETPTVAVRTVGGVSFADFLLPRGLPGVNAVPADNAVATYATGSGTATNTALKSFLLPRAETDATVAGLATSGSSALRPALTSFLLPRAETADTVAGLIGSSGVVRDALRAGFVRAGTSTVGSITSPAVELIGNSGSASTLHISSGTGFTGPYLFGLGNDSGSSPGFLVSNKAAGVGFYLDNQATATGTGMFAAQNGNAPLFDFVAARNNAPTMMVVRVDSTVSSPGSLAAFYGQGNAPILELHGNGGLGFFGKTPTGRQPRIEYTDTSGASLADRVNKLIGTLIEYGLIPANT